MATKFKVATKEKKPDTPERKNDHRSPRKPSSTEGINPQIFKKINPPELPVITITSGGNISHIGNALTTYCQRELGPISRIFSEGRYQEDITVSYDEKDLSKEKDPHGLEKARIIAKMKQADTDNIAYEKSKTKLYGIISSMTTKDVDEKLSIHRSLIATESSKTSAQIRPTASAASTPMAFFNCPLTLWKDIVHVVTTKTAGNKRIDQDKVTVEFATMRQRPTESLSDYHYRMSHTVASFEMLGLEKPPCATQAMRFIQGLDNARYTTMQTSFANELHNGRDLYPTDLPSAVLKASRWMVSGRTTQDSLRALATTKTSKDSKGSKDKDKTKGKREDKDKAATKCEFCSRTGHSMSACFKFKDAQAAATSATEDKMKQPNQGRKGTTMIARSKYTGPGSDAEDEHYLVNVHLRSGAASLLAAGKRARFEDSEIILDTGANGSIFSNPSLLSNIRHENTVTFDGISGVLRTDKVGDMGGLCPVHVHTGALANILSFSQLRQLGHSIRYYEGVRPEEDTFVLSYGQREIHFRHRSDGLYVHNANMKEQHLSNTDCCLHGHRHGVSQQPSTTLVTTVADNESNYSKREVAQAREARQLQRRLANPPDSKLIKAISTGTIQHSSVTPADVARATAIYGPSIEALKGRTTTSPALPFPQEGPSRAMAAQQMYADIFYANGMSFLITITHPIGHITCTYIERTDTVTLRRALRLHLGVYGQRRIEIRHIYSDNEKGILSMSQDFAGAGITLHLAGPGMHVHIVERAIRTIKEGVRGLLSGLPYPCPRVLFAHLIPFVAYRINMFPSSTRTDNTSSFQLMYNRHINANIDCHLEFSAYYQMSNRLMDNSMTPRTIGGI